MATPNGATDVEEHAKRLSPPEAEVPPHHRMEFLATAAHEIRGPVTVLVSAAETLVSMVGTPEFDRFGQQLAETMLRSGRRLSGLVNDLLTVAYLERGTVPLKVEEVPLLPILQWAVEAVGPAAAEVGIECSTDVIAYADGDRLEQILVNLIGNAVQHGVPPQHVRARRDDDRGVVEVVVSNDGRRISRVDSERLFEPFNGLSVQSSTSSGLGLSIARSLSRLMRGDLAYDIDEPRPTFRLTLPLADVTPPHTAGEARASQPTSVARCHP